MPWTSDIITTDRMRLRCPTSDDWAVIMRILTDAAVRRYLGGPVSEELLQELESRPIGEQPGLFAAVLTEGRRTIGTFSLEDEREDLELSNRLLPEFWGKGLAFEAVEALLRWGWDGLNIRSIIAVTHSSNDRSIRLLARLGFAYDSEFEEDGAPHTKMRLLRPT
jgi:RimJ/RimL family protein N-acetyltransferase